MRLAAAAGRDVGYPLLQRAAALPEPDVRESLRQAVEHGVLVADQATGSFRFRHALLAEAIYATILPGEREELHARLADELARDGAASPAELAPHWAAAGRDREALVASVEAARQAEAVFGLAEAHAHLERALALWAAVPDAAELAGLDLAELCSWTAELASRDGRRPARGRARPASDRARRRRAITVRAALLHVRLGRVPLRDRAATTPALAALERAVELVPADPPSPERAYALGSLAGGLMVAWRHDESLPICEQALALAREVGAREAEVRALTVLGGDLAYLGRGDEGLAHLRQALQLAERDRRSRRRWTGRTATSPTSLTMLGRPRESARVAEAGLEAMRRYGIDEHALVSNQIEALLAIGDWDEAERAQRRRAPRASPRACPHCLLILRADLEVGRGDFDAARAHLEAAMRHPARGPRASAAYDAYLAELALWERRWTDADAAVHDGLAQARQREAAQIRVQLCAKGLRAQAELAALARARRDADAVRDRLDRARKLLAAARSAAAEAAAVTPNAAGWLRAGRGRVRARPRRRADPSSGRRLRRRGIGSSARRSRPTAAGARPRRSSPPAPRAPRRRSRSGRRTPSQLGSERSPWLRELELLAQRARLDLASPDEESPTERRAWKSSSG